jgi:hypothetical protein
MPFAMVAKHWIPEDQSIPRETMRRIIRRDGVPPQVQAMSINTDFTSGDVKKLIFGIQAFFCWLILKFG